MREIGIYRVDDLFGTVRGVAQAIPPTRPPAPDRAQVIFGSSGTRRTLIWKAARSILLSGRRRQQRQLRSNELFFSIAEANLDGSDHLQAVLDAAGALTIEWDGGGDGDRHEWNGVGYGHENHNGNGYGHDDAATRHRDARDRVRNAGADPGRMSTTPTPSTSTATR